MKSASEADRGKQIRFSNLKEERSRHGRNIGEEKKNRSAELVGNNPPLENTCNYQRILARTMDNPFPVETRSDLRSSISIHASFPFIASLLLLSRASFFICKIFSRLSIQAIRIRNSFNEV